MQDTAARGGARSHLVSLSVVLSVREPKEGVHAVVDRGSDILVIMSRAVRRTILNSWHIRTVLNELA